MNKRTSKKLMGMAKKLSVTEVSYLTKSTQQVFTDSNGNRYPYMTSQTVLNPVCTKAIYKFLKTIKGVFTLEVDDIKTLVDSTMSLRVTTLASNGYKVQG